MLASVCYPGLPATDLAGSIFVTRPKNYDGSVFLLCWFSLPRFRNLAQTCPVFVSFRRFIVSLFCSPRNRCGICFCQAFSCSLHYVRNRCIFGHRICLQTCCGMPILALLLLFALRTLLVLTEASYLDSYRYIIYVLALPQPFCTTYVILEASYLFCYHYGIRGMCYGPSAIFCTTHSVGAY